MIHFCSTEAEVNAIENPKHVWENMGSYVVYTGDDIPANSEREILCADFQQRFTPDELKGFFAAANTDATAAYLMARVFSTPTIHLDYPEVINGLNYWVSIGKLASNRPNEIRGV